MSRRSRPRDFALALLLPVFGVSCGGEGGVSGPPDDGGDNPLRPGFTATVRVEPGSSALAEALGWTGGVPNAEVRLHRIGTAFAWQTAFTDAQGVANFPDVIAGDYRVAAYRPLTAAEVERVDGAALAFGDGALRAVRDRSEFGFELGPTVEGSVVISEVYATAPFTAEVDYDFHMFFELYNNSDETVFLDGMVWGTMLGLNNFDTRPGACAVEDRFRTDPTGIWAIFLHQFPGGGAEHPLLPGEAVVVALDAVDHSQVDPRFPDLSGAEFELVGSGDVDNPGAVNLPEVGVRPWPQGHGLRFFIGHTHFLASPVDPASLERDVKVFPGLQDLELLKVPASAVLDVVATEDDDALVEQRSPPCGPEVARRFDRLEGGFVEHGADVTLSVQRLVIGTEGGRAILQDTNTSAVDLIKAPYTPGTLP